MTIHAYDTRRTSAQFLTILDVHLRVAMRFLQHSQISIALEVHTQIPSPEVRKTLDS